MQTEEHRQFRLTPQVVIVLAVTMLALTLPITGVVLAFRGVIKPRHAEQQQQAFVPLQKALEEIAQKNLAPETLTTPSVYLQVVDLEHETKRIDGLIRAFSGVGFPSDPGENEIRLLVQLPTRQVQAFIEACKGMEVVKNSGNDSSRTIVEVVIRRKTP